MSMTVIVAIGASCIRPQTALSKNFDGISIIEQWRSMLKTEHNTRLLGQKAITILFTVIILVLNYIDFWSNHTRIPLH